MPPLAQMARWLQLVLALVGLIGVLAVLPGQVSGVAPCPALGVVPACYVVFAGFALIIFSTLTSARYRFRILLAGWLPLFLLALAGTLLEASGRQVCPKSLGDIPACYFSLGIIGLIGAAYWVEMRQKKKDVDAIKR